MARPRIGVALGGGAARGWAHIGVLRALADAGIEPEIIAGTSIGAVVGGCYAAGRLDAVEGFARELNPRKVFGYFDFNLSGSGLITGQRLCHVIEERIGHGLIEDLPRPFTAVATEVGTGHEIWLSRGRLADAMRASYAIPGVFKPVRINNRWLFDGALVNPIPVSVCRAMGATYVIAVNLNSDLFGRGTVLANMEAMPEPQDDAAMSAEAPPQAAGWGARQLIQRQLFGRGAVAEAAPSISTVVVDAFNIVHDRIARSRLAGDPPDCLLSPRLTGIGLFDFHRADELIARGQAAARRAIEDMQADQRLVAAGRAQTTGNGRGQKTVPAA